MRSTRRSTCVTASTFSLRRWQLAGKTQQRHKKKSPKLVCSTSQARSDSSKTLSSFISTSWRFGKNSTTLTGAQEARSLWGNSSKVQYYTQSWEGFLASFWENFSAWSLQEQKQSKTKHGGCSQSPRSKRISVKENSIGLLLMICRRLFCNIFDRTTEVQLNSLKPRLQIAFALP